MNNLDFETGSWIEQTIMNETLATFTYLSTIYKFKIYIFISGYHDEK